MVLETVDVPGFISWFEGIGGFDIILPFFLIFAVSFAVLDKVKVFEKKNINVIIAVILGLFLVMQGNLVEIIQQFLPRISMIVLSLLMLLLVAGTFGFSEFGEGWKSLSLIVAIVSIIWALGASVGWDVPAMDWFTSQDVAILLIIGVFILVIWFIVHEKGEPGRDRAKNFFKGFNDLFGLGRRDSGGS